jgi:hypothetical protein
MRDIVFLFSAFALMTCTDEIRSEELVSAKDVFRQLGGLTGTWSGHSANGRAYTVSFRYTAADSVLVETWTLGSGRESMTLYALDGNRLLATHYCPQGNQPRLEYVGADKDGRWQFHFVDGTNLHVKGRAHQEAFWIRVWKDGTFERGETYVDNDSAVTEAATEGESVRYTRIADR